MEFGDRDLRRRSVRCKQRPMPSRWNLLSESHREDVCHPTHRSDNLISARSLKKHVTSGLSMSKVILLSVVLASIYTIIASASQQQVPTIASQAVHSTSNLSADKKHTRQQQQQNITIDRVDKEANEQLIGDRQHESGLISSSSTPETLSTTPLAPPNFSTQSSTVATLSSQSTTPANILAPSTSTSPSRVGFVTQLNENGGDLSASSSVNIQSSQPLQQPKKSSQLAGSGNRWSQHFGARLRPLTPNGLIDHETASSSKASASLAGDGRFNRPPSALHQQQLAARQQSGFVGGRQPVTGNNEDNKNQEEDYDDDSEALLYKMMQQQNFLMNPIFQEQPTPSGHQQQLAGNGNRPEGQAQQRGQSAASATAANGNGQAQSDDLASSKKVIKLLKSYSHIHQVDDSDDQIRGTYTRLSSYRPNDGQMSSRDQYSSGSGNHNNAHNGNRRQQHVFVSSRPVATTASQTQGVRIVAGQPQADGNYRQAASAQRATGNSYRLATNQRHPGDQDEGGSQPLDGNESQDGNESGANGGGGGGPPPPQEEEEFECPNNGIFADVASGCQAYHVCQSGAQVQERFNCPLGTLFNDIILTCDFAHNVQCGKKPGEQGPAAQSAGLQSNDAAYNRQPSQQYQQQAAPRPQQASLPTGSYPRPQPQLPLARPASQGPRQLVIGGGGGGGGGGGSPYNKHNRQQQQASSQAQALGSYPAVKPLSNALSDGDNDGDEDDNEPLVPATLPPRAASTPQATGVIAPRLPYKAPPAPSAAVAVRPSQQPQQINAYTMPTSIQQQIPHQANRQSAHFSQYPLQQRPQQQAQFYPRPAQQANRYVTEASAPVRTYGEPNSRPTEPSVPAASPPPSPQQQYQQQSSSAPAVGSGSDNADNQSFNLVINHLTPTRGAGQQKLQQQQPQVPQAVRYSKPQEQSQLQPQTQKVTPVYKSQVSAERQPTRRLVAASYPIGQQQQQQPPAQVHHRNAEQNVAVSNQQQQAFQLQQLPGTQRQKLPFNSDQKYESQRRNNQNGNNNNHHQQQQSAHQGAAQVVTPAYGNEVAAATQRSVAHSTHVAPPPQQSNVNGLVDLTNGQQSGVGNENLNNGLLLIVRHSSGGPTLQVQNGGAASSSSAPKSAAYAVDPKLINPNSPIDAQLFPNVQQFVAEQHTHRGAAGSVTQASINRVTHVDPAAASSHTGRYPIVAGSLPPMTPPEPPREQDERHQQPHDNQGGAGEQYGAASSNHHDQRSAAGAIVPAASSQVAKSSQTSPQESVAATAEAQQKQAASPIRQKPAASQKKIQQQQQQQQTAGRTKRAKSSKPPAQLPKKLESKRTTSTTTTSTLATPTSAGTTQTTTILSTNSAQTHAKSDNNKRKQQTLPRGN